VGVPNLWIVDPLARTLEVFRLHEGQWLLTATHAGEERIRAQPFDAVELELSRWWIEPAP
jgi:Uma2 family endonuclease